MRVVAVLSTSIFKPVEPFLVVPPGGASSVPGLADPIPVVDIMLLATYTMLPRTEELLYRGVNALVCAWVAVAMSNNAISKKIGFFFMRFGFEINSYRLHPYLAAAPV
jgi:hypothetical protein